MQFYLEARVFMVSNTFENMNLVSYTPFKFVKPANSRSRMIRGTLLMRTTVIAIRTKSVIFRYLDHRIAFYILVYLDGFL